MTISHRLSPHRLSHRCGSATAHLIHGFVGVGKTTYAIQLEQERGAVRFTLDEWIVFFYGQDPPEECFEDYHNRVCELIWAFAAYVLRSGQDVILDFGFWSRASRDDAREKVRSIGSTSLLHCVTCADDVLKARVLARTQTMPAGALKIDESAISCFRARFEPLEPDESYKLVVTT
ncbi:MAG: AAA family ATPase [Phormidesmis sp.]|mgnify:CR=1 FL=1